MWRVHTPVLSADVIALTIALRWVVTRPEHSQKLLVADFAGIENNPNYFIVPGLARAHLAVRGVRRVSRRVAYLYEARIKNVLP